MNSTDVKPIVDDQNATFDSERGRQEPTALLRWEDVASEVLRCAVDEVRSEDAVRLLADAACLLLRQGFRRHSFAAWEERGFHLTAVHDFSAIPDTRTLDESVWTLESQMPGIDLNEAAQLQLLQHVFSRYQNEYNDFPRQPTACPHEFYFENGCFGGTDALVLYCMVRHFHPRRILEVGSGFSSRVSAQAAIRNGDTQLTCIEPYPDDLIRNGFPGLSRLIAKNVQAVALDEFEQLQSGDILFIDSSHVSRIGGDVNYLFLEVIPRLKPGVIVQIHDIFFPGNYPKDWVLRESRFWNEQYLLQAFLAFNSEFEVVLCNSYLGRKHRPSMQATFPNSPWWGGGSFWMRRILPTGNPATIFS